MRVNLVLGTMTLGQQVFLEEAISMLELFSSRGYDELDSAYVYNEGETERILGAAFDRIGREQFKVATKVNPRITGRLDGEAAKSQLTESLERMGLTKADIFYLHFPDPLTPVESVLRSCDEMYRAGKFVELGLSNFPAWMVADVHHKCRANGWVVPTVYEGVYNPLSRRAEVELFTALKAFDMRFYAYNPLAGGMLTGKHRSFNEVPTDGRFALRKTYPARYWKESFFKAVEIIRRACTDISMVEATFRWLAFHSSLDPERRAAIIIGASGLKQLEQNLNSFANGPLPDAIVAAFEEAWEVSSADAPEYFTLYKG